VRYANNAFVFGAGGRFALRLQVEYFGLRANGSTTSTVCFGVGLVLRIVKR
jgi:hypothetical protein